MSREGRGDESNCLLRVLGVAAQAGGDGGVAGRAQEAEGVVELRLIGLDGEQVVPIGIEDLLAEMRLTEERVAGDHPTRGWRTAGTPRLLRGEDRGRWQRR